MEFKVITASATVEARSIETGKGALTEGSGTGERAVIEQGVRSHEAGAVPERQTLVVEVAVYRTGHVYRAVCLDLSLIVERPTWSAAYTELVQEMHDYVADALDAGCDMPDVLRPVPSSERRYIYFRLALSAINEFVVSCGGFGRRSANRPNPEGFTRTFCSI